MHSYHERREVRLKKLYVLLHVGQNSSRFLIIGVTETVGLMPHMLRSV